ncbi:hypothetical protein OAT67_04585 [Bacteriovoracaceae bacterium]|nr:hypothetical protein [Bacteriovoracaceae bacterium]
MFFLALLPSMFLLAVLIEYFDRLEPFVLVKRALISILILTSVTAFYHQAIETSMEVADEILMSQKEGNILLMDMFDGAEQWEKVKYDSKGKDFYKNKNALWGTLAFLKYHMFDSFVNDGFTVVIYFLSKLCFLILKVVYSLVYYLGYGLIGIPCLIYLFPSMGNVLRGAILSFIWCLTLPHILVFIITMIGTEINKGYISGQIIGGSMIGTALLFILTLFIAFAPLIGTMILTGAGVSSAGGIIASMGANYVMNLPKNVANTAASVFTGGTLGPKMKLATNAAGGGFKIAKGASKAMKNSFSKGTSSTDQIKSNGGNVGQGNRIKDVTHISNVMKDLQKNLGLSQEGNSFKKPGDNSKVKFRLNDSPFYYKTNNAKQGQSSSRGVNNAKLSKYSGVNSEAKKTIDTDRRTGGDSKPNNTSNRSLSKYKNRK